MKAMERIAPSSDLRAVFPSWPRLLALWFVGSFSAVVVVAGLIGFVDKWGGDRSGPLIMVLLGLAFGFLALAHRSRLLIDAAKGLVIYRTGLWPLGEGRRKTINFPYPWHRIFAISMMILSLCLFLRGHLSHPADFAILNLVFLQQFLQPARLPSTTIGRLNAPFNRSSANFVVRRVGTGKYLMAIVDDDRCSILARKASLDHFIELNDLSRWLGLRIEADDRVMKEIDARR